MTLTRLSVLTTTEMANATNIMSKIRPAKERFLRDVWFYRELPPTTLPIAAERIDRHAELIGAAEMSVPAMREMAKLLKDSKDPAVLEVVGRLELLANQFTTLLTSQKVQRATESSNH